MISTERYSVKNPTRSEVAEKLQPVADLHGIGIEVEHLEFSGIASCPGASDDEAGADAPVTVRYGDIASVSVFKSRIEVLLHSGDLYLFSTTDSVKMHIDTYKNGGDRDLERPTTAHEIAENIWGKLESRLSGKKEG